MRAVLSSDRLRASVYLLDGRIITIHTNWPGETIMLLNYIMKGF